MPKTITLWGGPDDGRTVAVPHNLWEFRVPVLLNLVESMAQDPDPAADVPIGYLTYKPESSTDILLNKFRYQPVNTK